MRRTWSALRSIQVVVCLVLNVIEALVHPRHPPSASRSAPGGCPATILLEKLLEKLEASPPPKLSFSSSLFWTRDSRGGERERERGREREGGRERDEGPHGGPSGQVRIHGITWVLQWWPCIREEPTTYPFEARDGE